MDSSSAPANMNRSTTPTPLTLEMRPEWTYVPLGPDYRLTAAVVAGRILVTRTYGFVNTTDMENNIQFVLQVLADSQIKNQPYAHIMEWSELKGGTISVRNRFASFIKSQSQLKCIAFCGATSLMRMTIRVGKRIFKGSPPTHFFTNIDDGVRHCCDMLQLKRPDNCDTAPVLLKTHLTENQTDALHHLPCSQKRITYPIDGSKNSRLEIEKIGKGILYCRINGHLPQSAINNNHIRQLHHLAISHLISPDVHRMEIWNYEKLFDTMGPGATHQLFNTLLAKAQSLLGCVLLDPKGRIDNTTRNGYWNPSFPCPVHTSTSMISALLQTYEYLHRHSPVPRLASQSVKTRPEWNFDDGDFYVENQILNGQIIHTICRGPVTVRNVQRAVDLVYPLALEVAASGKPYYLIGNCTALRGGSYQARKTFANALRALFQEAPFRMYTVYGAQNTLLAGINLGRHKMPFRMFLADDMESAMAAIHADQHGSTSQTAPGNTSREHPQQINSNHFKQYADDILHYLGTVNWEPHAKSTQPGFADPKHPFYQVFGAIDLLKEDLSVLYQEQQKIAREQLALEAELARSRKMEALGLLAGGVAHDLNNVLSGIVTYPDVILMELPKGSNLCEPLHRIRESGQKAAAIVQDLLTLARRGVNRTTALNMNALIVEYIESPEHQTLTARYPDITLMTDLTSTAKEILGSAVHIKKTIMNLIYNAFEASSAGTMVQISTKNRYVDRPMKGYETIAKGEYVVLDITDQGTGIAETDLSRIFEPFYTKKKMGRSGTGLGMAVVWGTVQDHKGYIDIHTSIGTGTTFSLFFPVSQVKRVPQPMKREPLSIGGQGEVVLVVDDTKEQRELATAVLNLLNYQIKTVSSGEAALAYIKRNKVDLVLLDMILDPGIDGLETLKRIRKTHPHLPVIIATGYAEDKRLEEALKLCSGQTVAKPYIVQTLGEAIRNALYPR